jgi:hypothetical protein
MIGWDWYSVQNKKKALAISSVAVNGEYLHHQSKCMNKWILWIRISNSVFFSNVYPGTIPPIIKRVEREAENSLLYDA